MGCNRFPTLPDDTLVIDRNSSTCANCGKGASPRQQTHEDIVDWTPVKGGGCGIRWTKVASSYVGTDQKQAITEMRPDLEWVDQFPDFPDNEYPGSVDLS